MCEFTVFVLSEDAHCAKVVVMGWRGGRLGEVEGEKGLGEGYHCAQGRQRLQKTSRNVQYA